MAFGRATGKPSWPWRLPAPSTRGVSWSPKLPPASAKPLPIWCRLCCRASACCCRPRPKPCRTSFSRAIYLSWPRRWACPCAWRCSKGAPATFASTAWVLPMRRWARMSWHSAWRWPRWRNGPKPRARATWAKCRAWTSVRRSSPWSLPRVRTAWARNARSFAAATSTRRAARPWRPTWSSSTITCFLPTWPCVNRVWPSCCPPCAWWCLTRRISSMKRVCSFWAAIWPPASCWTFHAICWPPVSSTRAVWPTGWCWRAMWNAPRATCAWRPGQPRHRSAIAGHSNSPTGWTEPPGRWR